MADFLFGKDMKEFLIITFPFCAVLFVLMWISWGIKGALVLFGAGLFIIALALCVAKWVQFVDKYIRD